MFGFSVYLNSNLSHEDRAYIGSMKQGGFQGVLLRYRFQREIKKSISNGCKI